MSAEDLENYETDAQMALYREYKDVMSLFSYAVETDRRFYLANQVRGAHERCLGVGCVPFQPLCEESARLLGA